MAWTSRKEGNRVGVGAITEQVGEQWHTWRPGAGVGKRYGSCRGEVLDGSGQTIVL
jgi:hypothetical protein